MNPELRRNLWIECTPSRLGLMAGVVALAIFTIWIVSDGDPGKLAGWGSAGFFFLVIVWGARNAARSVLAEVRERTWDFQRLSALAPLSMTLGKLVGSTSYVWFGGLMALALVVYGSLMMDGLGHTLHFAAVLVLSGILAQAVAFGSALSAARRRRSDARVALLPHQVVGVGAPYGLWWVLAIYLSIPKNWTFWEEGHDGGLHVAWWGLGLPADLLLLGSYAVFTGFAVVGCWRLMRLELMATNRPIVWPIFLLFVAVYVAGYNDAEGVALLRAYLAMHAAALIAVLVEPKDLVAQRALGRAVAAGRFGEAAVRAPAFVWALFAAGLLAIAGLVVHVIAGDKPVEGLVYLAMLGFLVRDIAIFVFFHARSGQTRGDFAALVALALLYVAGGMVANTIGLAPFEAAVFPRMDTAILSAPLAWLQAGVMVWLALSRLHANRHVAAPVAVPA